jgi:hypothetical protein
MTEQEWLVSEDPEKMLDVLLGHVLNGQGGRTAFTAASASDRKLRLFACACCELYGLPVKPSHEEKGVVIYSDAAWAENWVKAPLPPAPAKAALLREICNPWRPVRLAEDWICTVPGAIAATIYEDRDWVSLPVLADSLEEAGCTDPAILSHVRGPGSHVRGCWALDLILGKQ